MLCSENVEMTDPRGGECILVPCEILHDIFVCIVMCCSLRDFCRRVYSTSIFPMIQKMTLAKYRRLCGLLSAIFFLEIPLITATNPALS